MIYRNLINAKSRLEEFEQRKSKAKRDEQALIAARRYYNKSFKPQSLNVPDKSKGRVFPFRCSKCGKYGHKAAHCPTRGDQSAKSSRQYQHHQTSGSNRERANLSEESFLGVGGEQVFQAETCRESTKWCLDSGSSFHSCKDRLSFETWSQADNCKLNLASNTSTTIQAKVRLPVTDGKNSRSVCLENTLYVPDLRVNLMSVGNQE